MLVLFPWAKQLSVQDLLPQVIQGAGKQWPDSELSYTGVILFTSVTLFHYFNRVTEFRSDPRTGNPGWVSCKAEQRSNPRTWDSCRFGALRLNAPRNVLSHRKGKAGAKAAQGVKTPKILPRKNMRLTWKEGRKGILGSRFCTGCSVTKHHGPGNRQLPHRGFRALSPHLFQGLSPTPHTFLMNISSFLINLMQEGVR